MSEIKVLVVEDDKELLNALLETLKLEGYQSIGASNPAEAVSIINNKQIDFIVSDVNFNNVDKNTHLTTGINLLQHIREQSLFIPFLLMTAYASVNKAVEALKLGAVDYLVKPFEAEQLVNIIQSHVVVKNTDNNFVAIDDETVRVKRLAAQVAKTDVSVLINGESGTGKEVLAQYIHQCSLRADGPFIAINCAAIPENMLEAMLFGYEKGAYTGAHNASPGKFEQAQGGTLLLDEITEMDISLQAKLLRVLQEKQVERLGGKKVIDLDVRILATTNRDLKQQVIAGKFREDLYYRLSVFPISLKPLRERPADISPIIEALLNKHKPMRNNLSISNEAIALLEGYQWPGNVREVDNVIQRAIVLSDSKEIQAHHIVIEDIVQANETKVEKKDENLKQAETNMILQALQVGNGSRKYAAEKLGISPRTLRYKLARLKEQGIDVPSAFGTV